MTSINLLITAAIFIGSSYALWLFYLAVMTLKRARSTGALSRPALVMGLPILWTGLVIDCAVNLAVATLLFLEPPQELLVTARLSRLVREDSGWRQRLSLWICAELLDRFDPAGHHCNCEGLH